MTYFDPTKETLGRSPKGSVTDADLEEAMDILEGRSRPEGPPEVSEREVEEAARVLFGTGGGRPLGRVSS